MNSEDKGCVYDIRELEGVEICANPKTNLVLKLTNENGNTFELIRYVYFMLQSNGYYREADEFRAGLDFAHMAYKDILAYISTFGEIA